MKEKIDNLLFYADLCEALRVCASTVKKAGERIRTADVQLGKTVKQKNKGLSIKDLDNIRCTTKGHYV